jgi:hypothetical protein
MYQPEFYGIALLFMIISMLCWGSWANTMKLCPGYRFQLFYWDYVIGLIVGAVAWGGTLGSFGSAGRSFITDITHAGLHPVFFAVIGGVIFNIANLLLVAAIDIAGLAVAFPIGIGLALVVWRNCARGYGDCAGRDGVSVAGSKPSSNEPSRNRCQSHCRCSDGMLLSFRFKSDDG